MITEGALLCHKLEIWFHKFTFVLLGNDNRGYWEILMIGQILYHRFIIRFEFWNKIILL